jgi:hypothetical protein
MIFILFARRVSNADQSAKKFSGNGSAISIAKTKSAIEFTNCEKFFPTAAKLKPFGDLRN